MHYAASVTGLILALHGDLRCGGLCSLLTVAIVGLFSKLFWEEMNLKCSIHVMFSNKAFLGQSRMTSAHPPHPVLELNTRQIGHSVWQFCNSYQY